MCNRPAAQGMGQDTKATSVNRETPPGLRVRGLRGTSESSKELSGLGRPVPLAFAARWYERVFRSFPGAIQDTPGLRGRFPVPSGAPERVFQHFMSEYRLC